MNKKVLRRILAFVLALLLSVPVDSIIALASESGDDYEVVNDIGDGEEENLSNDNEDMNSENIEENADENHSDSELSTSEEENSTYAEESDEENDSDSEITDDGAVVDDGEVEDSEESDESEEPESSENENIEIVDDIDDVIVGTDNQDWVTRIEWYRELVTVCGLSVEANNYPDNYYSDIDLKYEYYHEVKCPRCQVSIKFL